MLTGLIEKMKTRMKALLCVLISLLLVLPLCSCGNNDAGRTVKWQFTRTISREMRQNGWCFSFSYERMKDADKESADHIHYTYNGVNLRYQYHPDYVETYVRETEKNTIIEKYAPGILFWGDGSEEQKDDMAIIREKILIQTCSVDELLALDPNDYEFMTLDKDLFFRQMHDVLSGTVEPEKETQKQLYADKPVYAMLCEPEYLDGYKFQVAFLIGLGYVDEIFIDVLYETGPNYTDYIQLSDLVEGNIADEAQKEVFERIQTIARKIRGTDNFLTDSDEYENTQIGGIDFLRLFAFLKAIHTNEYQPYLIPGVIIDTQEIPK